MINQILKRLSTYFFIFILIVTIILVCKFKIISIDNLIYYLSYMLSYSVGMFIIICIFFIPALTSFIMLYISNSNMSDEKKLIIFEVTINLIWLIYGVFIFVFIYSLKSLFSD